MEIKLNFMNLIILMVQIRIKFDNFFNKMANSNDKIWSEEMMLKLRDIIKPVMKIKVAIILSFYSSKIVKAF